MKPLLTTVAGREETAMVGATATNPRPMDTVVNSSRARGTVVHNTRAVGTSTSVPATTRPSTMVVGTTDGGHGGTIVTTKPSNKVVDTMVTTSHTTKVVETSRHTNQNGASLLSKLAEEPAAASGGLGGLETPDCLVNGAAPSHAPTGGNTKHTQIIEMFTVNV